MLHMNLPNQGLNVVGVLHVGFTLLSLTLSSLPSLHLLPINSPRLSTAMWSPELWTPGCLRQLARCCIWAGSPRATLKTTLGNGEEPGEGQDKGQHSLSSSSNSACRLPPCWLCSPFLLTHIFPVHKWELEISRKNMWANSYSVVMNPTASPSSGWWVWKRVSDTVGKRKCLSCG